MLSHPPISNNLPSHPCFLNLPNPIQIQYTYVFYFLPRGEKDNERIQTKMTKKKGDPDFSKLYGMY